MSTEIKYRPNLKDRVDATIILCGFNLFSYCGAYGVNYHNLKRAISGDRSGRESQKAMRRLSSFFEEQGFGDIADELRETARLMEMEAA